MSERACVLAAIVVVCACSHANRPCPKLRELPVRKPVNVSAETSTAAMLADTEPRCAADDPACGPMPYNRACVEQTDYDPRAKRKLVYGENGREPTIPGQCTHDGECVIGGCGNKCIPTSLGSSTGTCEGRLELEHAYCGCVDTACVSFTTK
jgi:hypothetical protein